jgi:flagellar protein FliO/FliZ
MFDLLGTETPLAVKFFIAFAVVLALIGLTAWLVRRFGANRLGGVGRSGRQPRLAVIDAATVDGRRRLVLIRRDNIEHLLMIGGPTDLVVEPNIVRAAGNREVTREPGRNEPAARGAPSQNDSWPLAPINEPAPAAAAARSYRQQATEEPWHAPEPGARARPADSLTGLAAELSTRLNPPEAARAEPPPRVVAAPPLPPEPAPAPQTDHNLAEMAQQLEAALRRPPENRAPVTDPLAAAPRPPQRDYKLRVDPRLEPKFDMKSEPKADPRPEPKFEPKIEPKFEPKLETKSEPKFEQRSEPRLDAPPQGKAAFDNLEEEMASLLGRPSGKT